MVRSEPGIPLNANGVSGGLMGMTGALHVLPCRPCQTYRASGILPVLAGRLHAAQLPDAADSAGLRQRDAAPVVDLAVEPDHPSASHEDGEVRERLADRGAAQLADLVPGA